MTTNTTTTTKFKTGVINGTVFIGLMFGANQVGAWTFENIPSMPVVSDKLLIKKKGPKRKLKPVNFFKAKVDRVIDGDTYEVRVQLLPDIIIRYNLRLRGVDTSELRAPCRSEQQRAIQQKRYVEALIKDKPVWVSRIRFGKYAGRRLSNMFVEVGGQLVNVAYMLKTNGLVKQKCKGL